MWHRRSCRSSSDRPVNWIKSIRFTSSRIYTENRQVPCVNETHLINAPSPRPHLRVPVIVTIDSLNILSAQPLKWLRLDHYRYTILLSVLRTERERESRRVGESWDLIVSLDISTGCFLLRQKSAPFGLWNHFEIFLLPATLSFCRSSVSFSGP